MKCKSIIEIEKELRKEKHEKKRPYICYQPGQKGAPATWALAAPFVPIGVTNRDKMSSSVPVARPGTKGHPLLSRTGVPGWETRTTAVSQPGQINVFVVVELQQRLQRRRQDSRLRIQRDVEAVAYQGADGIAS